LLLDTYDVHRGIGHAIEVARAVPQHTLAAVRLDSGDLAADARFCRQALDDAGMHNVQILASGDLDEFSIDQLVRSGAPIDAFGVGTSIGTAAGSPSRGVAGAHLHSVYKLVWSEQPGVPPPIKEAADKGTWPGRKQIWRADDGSEDLIGLDDEQPAPGARALLQPVVRNGDLVSPLPSLQDVRECARAALSELPSAYRALTGAPAFPVRRSEKLQEMRRQALGVHQ
jgi:nicotinate phosphoribosyltransferase